MNERLSELIEYIEANPFSTVEQVLNDFYGSDKIFMFRKPMDMSQEEELFILDKLEQLGLIDISY